MLDEPLDSPVAKDPFVYRVITPDDWAEAQRIGHVPSVEVDRVDGYFHLSPHDQILTTAAMYFPPELRPSVLEFEAHALGPALVWETVDERGGRLFPHLYSATLSLAAATALIELEPIEGGGYRFAHRTALPTSP